MHIITCSIKDTFAVVPIKTTMRSWMSKQTDKPYAAINGSFFNRTTLKPVGTVYYDGELASNEGGGFGFGIKAGKPGFGIPWLGWDWYISGFPPIIQGGKKCAWGFEKDDMYTYTRRSAIARKGDQILMVTSKGNITVNQLTDKLLAIGVDEAITLDGGGSSCLMLLGEAINSPTEPTRPLANIIVCYAEGQETPEESETGGDTLNIICKKKTATLDKYGAAEKSRYIAVGDRCTIKRQITENLLIEIEYPTGAGKRTAYIRSLEGFTLG